MTDRARLRRRMRQQRAQLSREQIAQASLRAAFRLTRLPAYRRARHVAFYIADRGEIDPLPALLHASHRGKHCYLPRLHPFLKDRMWFIRWRPGDALEPNRFGIPEPFLNHRERLPNWRLDLAVVPLVAFDKARNRMGMGMGFYDRAFAFRRWQKVKKRPFLCGLAHAFQRVDQLETAPWDVAMDVVVTDQEQW